MDRRSFLRNGGILGMFIGAGGVGSAIKSAEASASLPTTPLNKNAKSFAPPQNATSLQLTGSYVEPSSTFERMRISSSGNVGIGVTPSRLSFSTFNAPPVTNTVSMTVGKDDRLWIKVGDNWKRVAVE